MNGLTLRAEMDGLVGRVRLTRDAKRNAIDWDMAEGLAVAITEFAARDVRVASLTAEGAMFSAGADTREPQRAATSAAESFAASLQSAPFPWLCGVRGGVMGGAVPVVLSCCVVLVTPGAWLSLPELSNLGIVPARVIAQLAPLIGLRAAVSLAVTERRVSAQEAGAAGWITEIVSDSELDARLEQHLTQLARAEPSTLAAMTAQWRQTMGRWPRGPDQVSGLRG